MQFGLADCEIRVSAPVQFSLADCEIRVSAPVQFGLADCEIRVSAPVQFGLADCDCHRFKLSHEERDLSIQHFVILQTRSGVRILCLQLLLAPYIM